VAVDDAADTTDAADVPTGTTAHIFSYHIFHEHRRGRLVEVLLYVEYQSSLVEIVHNLSMYNT
jgi:hypothetical protein